MDPTHSLAPEGSEVAILSRVLANGGEELPLPVARYLLDLDFGEQDKARMYDLAVRNNQGELSAAEQDELRSYAKAGCLVGILKSKARVALKKRKPLSPARH